MLNSLDINAALAEQIRRYIDQEPRELEIKGEPGVAPNLNSCILLVGIGNQGAKIVSRIMRQLNMIGICSDSYTGLALVDAKFPERDHQIEYLVLEDYHIARNLVPNLMKQEFSIPFRCLRQLWLTAYHVMPQ
ncbi:MAG: hypothetical protein P4L59_01875 [Desulfosporosinus sp.]|nr:hypothetical protein [Desulfosporosinus sp.]